MNKKLAQTYVYKDDKVYFVSTIDRESSSIYGGRYAETMVWEVDPKTNAKLHDLGILYMDEAFEGSIRVHQGTVVKIYEHGDFWNKEEEE